MTKSDGLLKNDLNNLYLKTLEYPIWWDKVDIFWVIDVFALMVTLWADLDE